MKRMLILLAMILLVITCKAQHFEYEITSNDKVVGSLSLKITAGEFSTVYEVNSKTAISALQVDYSYQLLTEYRGNEFQASSLITYLNGNVNSTVKASRIGDKYTVIKSGATSSYGKIIVYSEALLYTHEPKNIDYLYSEFLGGDKTVKKTGAHTYQFINEENGNTGTYTYKNGALVKAIINYGIIRFTIKKIK